VSNKHPIIIGAGLAGLLAAHAWPTAVIHEQQSRPRAAHRALLRFRSDAVSRLTGIEFRRVRVRKGIWFNGALRDPNIQIANAYSQKCLGRLVADRSIWNTEPVDRFVAPDTFYEQLLDAVGTRVRWGSTFEVESGGAHPIISTAPLPSTVEALRIGSAHMFRRASIVVVRATIPDADVFQTVYFPEAETPMYRASITGSTVIIEAMTTEAETKGWMPRALTLVARAFALSELPKVNAVVEQSYGKIETMPDAERKALLYKLTSEHNIYSLGRFATWRNVLLDDVVQDIDVIKRLLKSSSYDVRHKAS
jgi:hypothetical protein